MIKSSPRTLRPSLLAATIALSFAAAVPQGLAQQADDAQAPDSKPAKEGLETIVITAQKRAQNLQEVPVAVTAFTGDEMSESVIKDIYDLQTNVPGLGAFQSQSATNSSFSIRGVGTSSQNFGLESSVGLYVDGVYRARQNSMINNLVDVEAVEVLRGPQGTLFGKNTPSGAVLIRTVKPSHDGDDSFVEATVGNYGLLNLSGATSFSAIEDVLAFRVTAFSSQRDGIISDVTFGDDVINDRDRWGARLQALYTPNDDLTLRVIADYAEIDEICCGAPVQVSNFMAREIPGKFGSDAFLAGPPFNATVLNGGDDFFDRVTAVSFLPESRMKDRGLSAELTYDINDNYTLVSISALRKFDSYDTIDSDFTQAELFGTTNDASQESFSQELRIDYTSENLNAIIGAYYFTQDLDLDYSLFTDTYFNEFYLANFQGALDDLFNGINGLSAATGGLIAPVADAAPAGTGFDHRAEQEHKSYAIFGQFDYQLNDQWTLTAGLRYTDEDKELSTVFEENLPGGTPFPTFFNSIGDPTVPESIVPGTLIYGAGVAGAVLQGIALGQIDIMTPEGQQALQALVPFQTPGWGFQALGATTATRPDINATLPDDQITGTLKLSYQPDNNTLWYASVGTGYKSGGTNTDRIANGFEPIFDAETSTSYELGLKKDFPEQDVRVNFAAHHTTVDDFQANTFTGNGFNLQNAGDYEINGFELETVWLPTDNLEVKLSYALVDAEYKRFERGNCWVAYTWHTGIVDPGQESTDPANPNPYCNRSGDRPGGEPKNYAVLSVKQHFELSDDIYAYVLAEYSHTGEVILDGSNDPYAVQDSYNVLNLRFYMNFSDYDTDVILWGRNVTDEDYINRTNFNTPIQEGKMNAYVAEPATFGITVKKRF
ncbi:TonB-dependent receptor [Aestuariibacter halophilus]|uniref:TonB-dependent receptor n=1 Tax=Fluctibacter halophilus TaxID=226011 RepID=A0ABS8G4Z2_9ALTE|nr:TonB-dependent receptor [Aestuariibacter halophilus]MCC2615206.1 TonB-dependent receptor [Aestuariibacter halophilus]